MITNIPSFAKAPIQNYLKNGLPEDYRKEAFDPDDVPSTLEDFYQDRDGIVAVDNLEDDLDAREGHVKLDMYGTKLESQFDQTPDGNGQDFLLVQDKPDERVVLFARDTGRALDLITVMTGQGTATDIVITHLDKTEPERSFEGTNRRR